MRRCWVAGSWVRVLALVVLAAGCGRSELDIGAEGGGRGSAGGGAAGKGGAGGAGGAQVPCGASTCRVGSQVCCFGPSGKTCVASSRDCAGASVGCVDDSSCTGGQLCCGFIDLGSGIGKRCVDS